ncbi:uncharacterized protein BDW43DRAFT_279435 [Aspergillus alliaceus]|uniref:uncharacterized protein n=1 Tax=Petromyces alliaceus TaxID=209559 RepID=UPI0012A6EB42|nr:uncharacterized protein BDW43DRAFT_279435 [Aspergillus alliaceus]KAB8232447.1 hypothetical protein BDW43DRAFT_279435 [Aspergillus alliaceus]
MMYCISIAIALSVSFSNCCTECELSTRALQKAELGYLEQSAALFGRFHVWKLKVIAGQSCLQTPLTPRIVLMSSHK